MMKLRGLFYRIIKEKRDKKQQKNEPQEEAKQEPRVKKVEVPRTKDLPQISIQKSTKIIDFPISKDISSIDITYPLLEPFSFVRIAWDLELKELKYSVIEPELSSEESKQLSEIGEALIETIDIGLNVMKEDKKSMKYLQDQVAKVVDELGLTIKKNSYPKIMYYIHRNFVGFNKIQSFFEDPNIEDISCDGVKSPLYIVHRKYGSLRTNIIFNDLEKLRSFVVKLSERTGRYVSYAEPILDGTLPDGSRVAATYASDVSTRGPTFTIRKFSEKPFSPIEQVDLKTVSPEILAYLWYLIENGASMLIVGGVATGKTSFLNTVSMFIVPEAKIVSIEDTREIRIPHQHWIASLARSGFGIPMPTGERYGEVTLFDLLRESFRQNPDYVIVGEVRGKEAYIMFQGMSSGHPSLSTFHAGSVDTVIKRLTTPPIELSPTLLESLDVVIVMIHAQEKGKSARRIREISEITSVDANTNEVNTNTVFKWNPNDDDYTRIHDSIKLNQYALARGMNIDDAKDDVDFKEKVLRWLLQKGVKDYIEFVEYISLYYKDRRTLDAMMKGKISSKVKKVKEKEIQPTPVEIKTAEFKKKNVGQNKRISILESMGHKIIKEV